MYSDSSSASRLSSSSRSADGVPDAIAQFGPRPQRLNTAVVPLSADERPVVRAAQRNLGAGAGVGEVLRPSPPPAGLPGWPGTAARPRWRCRARRRRRRRAASTRTTSPAGPASCRRPGSRSRRRSRRSRCPTSAAVTARNSQRVGRPRAALGAAADGRRRGGGESGVGCVVVAGAHQPGLVVHTFGHVLVIHEVDLRSLEADAVEQIDHLVAVHLLAVDQGVGDPLDLLAVGGHQSIGGHVRLADDLRRGALLVLVAEDRSDRVLDHEARARRRGS